MQVFRAASKPLLWCHKVAKYGRAAMSSPLFLAGILDSPLHLVLEIEIPKISQSYGYPK